jgi:2-methylcitrate dehydratase
VRDQASAAAAEPTEAQQLAEFVDRAEFADIPSDALDRLKRNLLDAIGCAFGALDGPPIVRLREQFDRFGGAPIASTIGGGRTAPDRAAAMNTALTRYLDFMDSFMAKGETCHPSDNIGPVLAAAETAGRSGRDFLLALAIAYEVECRLTKAIPIMNAGFDHTTQLGISVAAGVAKALCADCDRIANAIAISASDFASLAVIRASPTSEWKGLASSAVAFGATHSAFLATEGVTGPLEVFEGPKGFFEAIGEKGDVDWSDRPLRAALDTSLKKYNAEVHTQSAIDALLAVKRANRIAAEDVASVEIETFLSAYEIVGNGEYGDRTTVETKEQADHSLPYLAAVALLDGDVMPEQFLPERIGRSDVQALLGLVTVKPHGGVSKPKELVKRLEPFTRAYPDEMPARVRIRLRDGRSFDHEQASYEGFHDAPMSWDRVIEKFERLAERATSRDRRDAMVDAVRRLEWIEVADLARLLRLEPAAA